MRAVAGGSSPRGEASPAAIAAAAAYLDQAHMERAADHGAPVARGLRDEDYVPRGFTVSDPEAVSGASAPT